MMEKQFRIAMLSVHSCPLGKLGERDTGGMSVYIRELAREMGKRGHIVDVYTRVHDPNDDEVYHLGDNARLIHLKVGEDGDMQKLMLYPHLAEFACNLESFRRLNDLRYDLLHSHYWLSGWAGERVRQWWNIPHVIMFHTLGASKNAVGVGEEEPELRIQTENNLANSCHRIIAATQQEKSDLVHYFGASPDIISVVPCGVNLEMFQPVDRELARKQIGLNGEKVILYVGRIDPLKGVDNLLAAAGCLSGNGRMRLIIVGGDDQTRPETERLKRLVKDLRIDDKVFFAGPVAQESLPSLYSAADVCVVPSYYESFGLVALESLACGTPVIATRVGGTESVIKHAHAGYLVESNAPQNLADMIDRLLSEQDSSVRSVDYIRESVTEFSWSNVADAMLLEYEETIKKYNAGALAQ